MKNKTQHRVEVEFTSPTSYRFSTLRVCAGHSLASVESYDAAIDRPTGMVLVAMNRELLLVERIMGSKT